MPYSRRTSTRRTVTTRAPARRAAPSRYAKRKTYSRQSVAQPTRAPNKTERGMSNSWVPALSTPKYYGKVRYGAAALTFGGLTGTVGVYTFSANGLFDPNVSGGALRPSGFDQLMQIYEHYTAYRSRITVFFTNNSTQSAMVGIAVKPESSSIPDQSAMLELPYQQLIQLEPAGVYGSTKTLSMGLSMSKYFGENVLKTTGIYRGDVISNPTEQVYYQLLAYGIKGASSDIFINVKIEYDAMFTEPRELSASLRDTISAAIRDEHRLCAAVSRVHPLNDPESKESKAAEATDQVTTSMGLMSMFR